MAVVKRSISFDPELLERAEDVARTETDGNLSALIGEALDHRVKNSGLRALLEEDIERVGGIPPEIEAEVERRWAELERED